MALLLLAIPGADTDGPASFSAWQLRHKRIYSSAAEKDAHFGRWATYVEGVQAAGLANPHATFAPDEFADWSEGELEGLRGGPLNITGAQEQEPFDDTGTEPNSAHQPPNSFSCPLTRPCGSRACRTGRRTDRLGLTRRCKHAGQPGSLWHVRPILGHCGY